LHAFVEVVVVCGEFGHCVLATSVPVHAFAVVPEVPAVVVTLTTQVPEPALAQLALVTQAVVVALAQ